LGAEKTKVAVIIVLLIITLILSYISFTSVWWGDRSETEISDSEFSASSEFKLEEVEMKIALGTEEEEETLEYEDLEDEDIPGLENILELFKTIYNLMILLFILIIISIIITVVAYFKKVVLKVLPAILIFTFLFALMLAAGFAVGLPMAFKQDWEESVAEIESEGITIELDDEEPLYAQHFAGDEKEDAGTYIWGPSTGWWLMVLVFILMGISAITALLPLKKTVDAEIPDESSKEPELPITMKIPEPPVKIKDDLKDAIVMDEPTYDKTNVFECPKCGNEFKLSTSDRPVYIRCPHCKVEGWIR
jgi:hypothetical protein